MNEAGLKLMKELNADTNDMRSGYHWVKKDLNP